MVIYLMVHFPFFIFWKIGFAHYSVTKRARALDKAVFGRFWPVGFVAIPFAYPIEQWFHRKFRYLQFSFYKGDGSTETYLFPAAIPVIVFMLAVWGVKFWAAGRMFGFDGLKKYGLFLEWLWCFIQVWWGWACWAVKHLVFVLEKLF